MAETGNGLLTVLQVAQWFGGKIVKTLTRSILAYINDSFPEIDSTQWSYFTDEEALARANALLLSVNLPPCTSIEELNSILVIGGCIVDEKYIFDVVPNEYTFDASDSLTVYAGFTAVSTVASHPDSIGYAILYESNENGDSLATYWMQGTSIVETVPTPNGQPGPYTNTKGMIPGNIYKLVIASDLSTAYGETTNIIVNTEPAEDIISSEIQILKQYDSETEFSPNTPPNQNLKKSKVLVFIPLVESISIEILFKQRE